MLPSTLYIMTCDLYSKFEVSSSSSSGDAFTREIKKVTLYPLHHAIYASVSMSNVSTVYIVKMEIHVSASTSFDYTSIFMRNGMVMCKVSSSQHRVQL